jgi:hypothetical protein
MGSAAAVKAWTNKEKENTPFLEVPPMRNARFFFI